VKHDNQTRVSLPRFCSRMRMKRKMLSRGRQQNGVVSVLMGDNA
jgi:hypothetical protein